MKPWHAQSPEEVLSELETDRKKGLTDPQVAQRLEEYGRNQLQVRDGQSWWQILLEQFKSVDVYLLGAAAIIALATARWPEGLAVVAVIAVNTAIGFFSEWKAVRSMEALRELGDSETTVIREGERCAISQRELVPGDIVELKIGDLVPADLRVLEASHLRLNEAPLTGESVPANKTPETIPRKTPLAERSSMVFKGTNVADGEALGVVVQTGTDTELGRISQLAAEAEATVTPLQKRLNRLGQRLAWLTIAIAAGVAGIGFFLRQQEATLVVETALALGIAAIPEGLPIVATIALARGMYRMAKRNALVNQLAAVETLGATRVIFSDKTGTLTENRMQLRNVVTPDGKLKLSDGRPGEDENLSEGVKRAVTLGVLCNGASLDADQGEGEPDGDPTEVALLSGGRELGLHRDRLLDSMPEVRVEQFEPRVKKMATFHREEAGDGLLVAVKGAPGAVLEVCTGIRHSKDSSSQALGPELRKEWQERAEGLAKRGLRVLAVAEKTASSEEDNPYQDLCFVGLLGLFDPPREDVKAAIDRCQAAGIRVEMVTGDQPETAGAVAAEVGIVGDPEDPDARVMQGESLNRVDELNNDKEERLYNANIFARVSPEQKLNLVRIYQRQGEIVAMTGDGVNDAPALKKADIGVAMGERGTEAARQVADMVLLDDAFETIVAAVEQGRVIFRNIRKSVMFMLTTNVAEVIAVTVATIAGWPLPLLPLQILFLNVLTDVFPALALGVGPSSGHEMEQPPRDPDEPVLTRSHWVEITGMALLVASCVLGSLMLSQHWLGLSSAAAVTVSFLTIAFGKLWYTLALREPQSGMLVNEVTRNPWVWGALALCTGLLLAAVYLPGLSDLLSTEHPGANGWFLILAMSLIPFLIGQLVRVVQARIDND